MVGQQPKIKANRNKVLGEDYEINEADAGCIHVIMDQDLYNPIGGAKISKPRIQTFSVSDFVRMDEVDKAFIGQKVNIIHDPRLVGTEAKATKPAVEETLSAKAATELHAAATTAPATQTSQTPIQIASMRYFELYKEQPPAGSTLEEIEKDIKEKEAFLAEEAKSTKTTKK